MNKLQFLTIAAILLSATTMTSASTEQTSAQKIILEVNSGLLSWVPNLPPKKEKGEKWEQFDVRPTSDSTQLSWVPNLPPKKEKGDKREQFGVSRTPNTSQLSWVPNLPPKKEKGNKWELLNNSLMHNVSI